ncbi:MAG: PAC2 family protein [Dehalococcoidia bacterium]|nr:PAC2 family protein [Dehalococcoidia bacterium]
MLRSTHHRLHPVRDPVPCDRLRTRHHSGAPPADRHPRLRRLERCRQRRHQCRALHRPPPGRTPLRHARRGVLLQLHRHRPSVRASPSGTRVLQWPQNEFFYARNPTGPHDVVVCIGTEPNLRWPTFAQAHADVLSQLNVETVITLGALLADVPHTRPTKVNGRSNDPELAERLNLEPSRYEGPTGIIGVLHQAFEAASLPAMSFLATRSASHNGVRHARPRPSPCSIRS